MQAVIRQARHAIAPLSLLVLVALIVAMRPVPSALERVQARGELVVAGRLTPSTWYQNQHGETGLEFELAQAFADSLGVRLRMVPAADMTSLHELLAEGEVDMAAAALAITPERSEQFQFTGAYQSVTDKLVYRLGEDRPRRIEALAGHKVAVLADSAQESLLRQLRAKGFDLAWDAVADVNAERLLTLVDEGYVDYALVDSNTYLMNRLLFPELAAAMDMGEEELGWAFPGDQDQTLLLAAQRFLTQRKADGTIARLEDHFYGHIDQFNLYAARSFLRHIDDRLPRYAEVFQEAAAEHGFDWRLIAAMGYQESLWNPKAVSPTGVRGLMMLTNRTAAEMGVEDRTNAEASIRAGAAYLRKLYDRIPERIADPDRTWLAVAAYNVGMGHVEDARVLTQKQGGNPDSWADVRQRLPLLRKPEYYSSTRHGYARGGMQSVIYVRHIRRYYDLLVWANDSERHGPTLLALASTTH